MTNKIIEEFIIKFGGRNYTASYDGWDLDPEKVEAFITEAIQSAKKEAVEESDREWRIAIGHTCNDCYKKIVNKMGQRAKELLK